jgi:hypothetical protein
LFREGPKRVGRNSIEVFNNSEPYSFLLKRYRNEFFKKQSLQGLYTNKNNPSLSPLTLFIQSPTTEVFFEPIVFSQINNQKNAIISAISQSEQNNSSFFNVYAWSSSSVLSKLITKQIIVNNNKTSDSFFFLNNVDFFINNCYEDKIIFDKKEAFFAKTYDNTNLQLVPMRSLNSLSLIGNKYFLIHRHLTQLSKKPDSLLSSNLKYNSIYSTLNYYSLTNDFNRIKKLPLGSFFDQQINNVISNDNIFIKNNSLDNTFFGILTLDDFNLTNSAASSLINSLGLNSTFFNNDVLSIKSNLYSSSFTFSNNKLFSYIDFSSDWSFNFLNLNLINT